VLTRITETLAIAAQQDALVERDDAPWESPDQISNSNSAGPARRWVSVGTMSESSVLARLRKEKLALQRHVDVINLKPEKLGKILWGLSSDYGRDVDLADLDKPEAQPPAALRLLPWTLRRPPPRSPSTSSRTPSRGSSPSRRH
jgi:hypothetical protein